VIGWDALHNLLVNRDDSNVANNGFAHAGWTRRVGRQRTRAAWFIGIGAHSRRGGMGENEIHIIARPDQARNARLRVHLDADGTGARCQYAGEKTPISRAQYIL